MVNSYKSHSGFSLLELIFALVIIAISVASIPIMTNAIGKGVENNIVQETIFGAAAEMNQALSYRWDENSIDESIDPDATGLARVINDGNCIGKLKPGHIPQELHRMCLDNNTTTVSSTFGSDGTETSVDDVDDLNGDNGDLFTGLTSAEAYKEDFAYRTSVTASDMDGELTNTNNAKKVTVSVYSKNDDGTIDEKVSELTSYTFNIGEIDYYKRMYP